MQVLVVVPTYQEAGNITPFLTAVRAACPTADVLVVDDNSPDGTGMLADDFARRDPAVTVLHRTRKAGLGSAYRHGFAEITASRIGGSADVIVTMDGDFSHDPTVINQFVAALADGADVVVGSRYVDGGGTVDWPMHRRLLSRWGNRYTAAALGLRVHDCTSGFRAYRRDALAAIQPEATSAEGYAFLTELLRRANRAALVVVERPIRFVDRRAGESKMSMRIIAESMLLVTGWGVRDRLATLREWRRTRRTAQ